MREDGLWNCLQSLNSLTAPSPSAAHSPFQAPLSPGLLPAPEDTPVAQFLPVAWCLFLPATTPTGLTLHGPHLAWWKWQLRQIFWYSSPPSLGESGYFFLNPNAKYWSFGHHFPILFFFLVFLLLRMSQPDLIPVHNTGRICQRSPWWGKSTKFYIFSISFAFPSWSSNNHMPLVIIIKALYSYSPPANAMGPE